MADAFPTVGELTSVADIRKARVVERAFDRWALDQRLAPSHPRRGELWMAFRDGFDLARQLFLKETTPGAG